MEISRHLPPGAATRNGKMTESMTDDGGRISQPAPEPEHPNQIPDGRDLRPENEAPSQSSGFRSPFEWLSRGRDVITIASSPGVKISLGQHVVLSLPDA